MNWYMSPIVTGVVPDFIDPGRILVVFALTLVPSRFVSRQYRKSNLILLLAFRDT